MVRHDFNVEIVQVLTFLGTNCLGTTNYRL